MLIVCHGAYIYTYIISRNHTGEWERERVWKREREGWEKGEREREGGGKGF